MIRKRERFADIETLASLPIPGFPPGPASFAIDLFIHNFEEIAKPLGTRESRPPFLE
jgi:hypothetical protein